MEIKNFLGVEGIDVIELSQHEIEMLGNAANRVRIAKLSIRPEYTIPEQFTKENIEKLAGELAEASFISSEVDNSIKKKYNAEQGGIYLNRYLFKSMNDWQVWIKKYNEQVKHER